MFKVRNIGGCIQSGNCTTNCPVAIDVNYEINNYNKVTNTNCTSCLICTSGCPSDAISYQWKNPFDENINFKFYTTNKNMYMLKKIKNKFKSFHKIDFILFPLILIFGFAIDGLYGMGHLLSFGIAIIASTQIVVLKEKIKNLYIVNIIIALMISIFIWHGVLKFSIWKGLSYYDKKEYSHAIYYLERVIKMHPKSIGRFYMLLAQMYLDNGELEKSRKFALKAHKINPSYNYPLEFIDRLNKLKVE